MDEASAPPTHTDLAGYDAMIGLEFDEVGPDRIAAHVEIGPRHHQPNGIVHGGVHAGIIESLASYGAAMWAWQNLDGKIVVGVANATDFLRAHREGRLDAVAEPVHRGRTQQLWQVVISRASDGKQVARGQVRLHNIALDDVEGRGR